ncbi:PAS domain S-box protein [Halorubrum sp. DTA98]|uniref:PAS domain S-box protein n=1 Tax=Halorubrum sp. DTA98 TaxID=3402163 RepID=UPI003AACC415
MEAIRGSHFRGGSTETPLVTVPRDGRNVFDGVADGLAVHDPDSTRIVDINETYLEMVGYEYGEIVGETIERLSADDPTYSIETALDRIQEASKEEKIRFEWQVRRRDGTSFPAEVILTLVDIDDRERVLASVRDISDRKTAERDALEHRNKYRVLAENFPNGVVSLVNEELEYELVVGQWFGRLDLCRSDLEGSRVSEALPEPIGSEMEARYRSALNGESCRFETEVQDRIARIRVRPVRENGSIVAAMGMSQDVTVERRQQRTIETARRKYLTLIDASPDPIVVTDVETGAIVETNEAAAELFGTPQQGLVGRHYTDLYPEVDEDQYRRQFNLCVERQGSCRRLPNGDRIRAIDNDGIEVPVEWSTSTVELEDRHVVYTTLRDVSDHVRYEDALETLNEVGEQLLTAGTNQSIADIAVDTTQDVTDATSVKLYLFNDDEGVLEPIACSDDVDEHVDELPTLGPNENIAWHVFETGSPETFDDVRADDADRCDPDTVSRSEIVYPLGDHGVLLVGSAGRGAYAENTTTLLELLGAKATAAFDRVERERSLRRHERELRERNERLELLAQLNGEIRGLTGALITATTRTELERAVCEQLAENDRVEFVWIAERDPVDDRIVERQRAGDGQGYLDRLSKSIDDGHEPTFEAIRTGELSIVENTAKDARRQPWRGRALERGFKSVFAVPIRYEDSVYGVLTVYVNDVDPFRGPVRSVWTELGRITGYAINAVQRKNALVTNQATELEFRVTDLSCFVLRFAQRTDTHLRVEGMVPQESGTTHLFVTVVDGSADGLLEHAKEASEVDSTQFILDDESEPLVQLEVSGTFIGTRLADHGIKIKRITAAEKAATVVVGVSPTMNVHTAVETLTTLYPDSELTAQRSQEETPDTLTSLPGSILDRLTARQREAIELAYRSGYFTSPKQASGVELADMMDLSTSAFHRHLRAAERTILSGLLDGDRDG